MTGLMTVAWATTILAAVLFVPTLGFADEIVNDALVRAGIPRAEVEAIGQWDDCTANAADRFADQQEPARTVAEAAMATCVSEEARYLIALHLQHPESLHEATMPSLIARIMAARAARPGR